MAGLGRTVLLGPCVQRTLETSTLTHPSPRSGPEPYRALPHQAGCEERGGGLERLAGLALGLGGGHGGTSVPCGSLPAPLRQHSGPASSIASLHLTLLCWRPGETRGWAVDAVACGLPACRAETGSLIQAPGQSSYSPSPHRPLTLPGRSSSESLPRRPPAFLRPPAYGPAPPAPLPSPRWSSWLATAPGRGPGQGPVHTASQHCPARALIGGCPRGPPCPWASGWAPHCDHPEGSARIGSARRPSGPVRAWLGCGGRHVFPAGPA